MPRMKISRRKLSWIHTIGLCAHAMFTKKTFMNAPRSAKSVKFFSLEHFPLYGAGNKLSYFRPVALASGYYRIAGNVLPRPKFDM